MGSSDHCTVSVTSSFTPPPPIPPTQRHLWHFENARRVDMSNFLLDFPWNDYCFRTRDPDLAATAVGDVVDSGMRAYIPYSLTTFSPSNPWFDRACSSAISDREGAHRSYQASPSELTHATFIYNSFYSQLVRFSSVCSKFNDFDIRSRNLLESLLNRGFSKYRLKNSFSKFALNHHDVLDIKYSMEEINEFIRSHFS